jgi:PelA/Pel-15E family pectate lyase
MGIEKPSADVIASIEGAVRWFEAVKINGIRLEHKKVDGSPKGYDLVVVRDSSAPAQWARFYDVATNKPMFCGRDGVVKSTIAEIEYERRNGYRWYVDRPANMLEREYPQWKKRI